jgi:pimeloyl-ACP methyl ester carboxylesterase/predicted ester cyclase
MGPRGNVGPKTPLVLLPGTLCDDRLFISLRYHLADREILTVALSEHDNIEDAISAVLANAPPDFALLGFSLGGVVALGVAQKAADRVSGLALIGATPHPVPQQLHQLRRASVDTARLVGMAHHARSALWPNYVAPDRRGDAQLCELVLAMAGDQGVDVFARQTELALSRPDYGSALAEMTMPSLVLAGTEDALNPPDVQKFMAGALPNAAVSLVSEAGHFVLLEQTDRVAAEVGTWLERVDAPIEQTQNDDTRNKSKGGSMSDSKSGPKDGGRSPQSEKAGGAVLQVERRDFPELVSEGRERVQSLRGFDDFYTDIVDYIVRCTHKIWDERDVGLIYTHYTWNCVAYTTLGTMYDRETHIRDTLQRLVEFPERRGMAQQVLWRGNDVDGFYTSHMTHGIGRHTQFGMYGKPTGRNFITRTVADCMILENKIYKEWIVRDNMGPLIQLGLDPHRFAAQLARKKVDAGEPLMDVLENRRMLGQNPPETEADVSIAHNDGEAQLLRDLHHIYNRRMFGRIEKMYAPNCQWHGPLMRELYGPAAVLQQTMRLVALMPDSAFVAQHICAVESEEGGTKYAVRWIMEGHHLGYGPLGAPTGHPLSVMGISHFHIRDGKIVEEWVVYDELSMLVQIKMAAMQQAGDEPMHDVGGM